MIVLRSRGIIPLTTTLYSTTFPATENPISESGVWTTGNNSGSSATIGPQSSSGLCYAQAADGVDYIATVPGRFTTTKHYTQATINRKAGYTAPDTQEIELLVGFTLGSGVTAGYELDFWFGGTTLEPVRWNAVGDYDFTAVTTVSGAWPGSLADGDVVKAVFDSSSGSPVITVYLNGVSQIVLTDTTAGKITSGSPGLGFFVRTGAGLDLTGYCAKGFSADNA